jgi:hypothetical protein
MMPEPPVPEKRDRAATRERGLAAGGPNELAYVGIRGRSHLEKCNFRPTATRLSHGSIPVTVYNVR